MKSRTLKILAVLASIILAASACSKTETPSDTGAQQNAPGVSAPAAAAPAAPEQATGPLAPGFSPPAGIVAEVDGKQLTEAKLEQDYQRMYGLLKQKLPEDKFKEEAPKIKSRLVTDFIMVTLLGNEIAKRNIKASDKEVETEINNLKASLKPGATIEEQLKKSNATYEQLKQDTAFGIKVSKLVKQYGGAKLKPKDKDIKAFYNQNRDKFNLPERVHARHILISVAKTDDDKAKAEKKAKAEDVRAKLVGGADFAQLANLFSDCPSKKYGGDLGTFPRGQMVKAFEDAAFSQNVKDIGPVVQTDFGYHVIQVLEKFPAGMKPLDAEAKKMISQHLERQNQISAYQKLLQQLRDKAKIAVYKQY